MSKYEIILDVCKTGSISKTAAKLNYSQSAVSQLIKSFETELGLTLFKRTKHGVQLLPNTEESARSSAISRPISWTASSYPGIRFPITRSFPWEKTS